MQVIEQLLSKQVVKTDLSQYPRIILGYHGCDRSVADKVFQEGIIDAEGKLTKPYIGIEKLIARSA